MLNPEGLRDASGPTISQLVRQDLSTFRELISNQGDRHKSTSDMSLDIQPGAVECGVVGVETTGMS